MEIKQINRLKIPFSIAVIENYKIKRLYSNNKNISFQAASISKPITAVATLRLVEEGKLKLNEDVNNYLKKCKVRDNKGNKRKVTLKQLLSHTGGINVSGFRGYSFKAKIPTLLQVLNGKKPSNTKKILSNKKQNKYSYSGGGYIIIQKILEDITNKPFNAIIKQKILKPLRMKNSNYRMKKSKAFHVYPEKAPAGLWTTPEDLAKFMIEIQLSYYGRSNKILSKRMTRLMFTPIMKATDEKGSIALGFYKNGKKFFHDGHNYRFRSRFLGDLNGTGYIVMVNSDKDKDLNNVLKMVRF